MWPEIFVTLFREELINHLSNLELIRIANKNSVSTNQSLCMYPINVDTPTNLVKVFVLSISKAKHPKPKIIQPLASLIPLQPNQKKWQSIHSTRDSCTSASKKVHLYSNLCEPFIKPRRIVSWLSITITATTTTRHVGNSPKMKFIFSPGLID
jgi:hypothetical protein